MVQPTENQERVKKRLSRATNMSWHSVLLGYDRLLPHGWFGVKSCILPHWDYARAMRCGMGED